MRLELCFVAQTLLLGREHEMAVIERHLAGVGERGSALLIRGDAGIGKSALLRAAKSLAIERSMSVLSAIGVQSETNLPFTGIYELLRAIVGRSDRLPGPQQNALRAAFGLVEGTAADLFLIALGALDLLADFASERPLLLLVDDVQWFDPASAYVLGFISRRLESDPIVLLAAGRDTTETTSLVQFIPELEIEALNDATAGALLDTLYPDLRPDCRERVLEESGGNPLALVEFPKAIAREYRASSLPTTTLPLTTRLERVFAEQVAALPPSTRSLLLVAALHEGSNVAEVMNAARLVAGAEFSLAASTPAVNAGLIHIDTESLAFRHPLVRSALYDASSLAERIAAHAALATVLNDPDSRVWHRSAATVELDETVAEDLEALAMREQQRGCPAGTIRALDRAAQLSADMSRIGRCLLKAAELAYELAWTEIAAELIQRAQRVELPARDRLKLKFYGAVVSNTLSSDQALVEIADSIKTEADVDLALDLLTRLNLAGAGWWIRADERFRNYVISAIESSNVSLQDDPRFLFILANCSPIERGAFILERLCVLDREFNGDAESTGWLGLVALLVGDFKRAKPLLDRAADDLRSQGKLPRLAHVLLFRARIATYLADFDTAVADAEEAERLARETAQPYWVALAQTARAILAAVRGDRESVQALTASADLACGSSITFSYTAISRGFDALSSGRYEEAYRHFRRLFDRTDSAYSPMRHCFTIGDLAEAAVQSNHTGEARAILSDMQALSERIPSPQFHAAMYHARAILADDKDSERLFNEALAADIVRSPFVKARLQLAFGTWLRRARRVKEARASLQAAVELFDKLSAVPWSERARQELRNAGVVPQHRVPDRREDLTPQELQIALMAAEGLSNQEIGQRLFLSHRTVGSHLYRLFPKLQITSRYQLRDVLLAQ